MVIERGFDSTKQPIIKKAAELSAQTTELLGQGKVKEADAVRGDLNKAFDDINFLDAELSGVLKRLEERGIKQATVKFQVAKLVFVEPIMPGSKNKEDGSAKQTAVVDEPAAHSSGRSKFKIVPIDSIPSKKRGTKESFIFPDGKNVELTPGFLKIAKAIVFSGPTTLKQLAVQFYPDLDPKIARQRISTEISHVNMKSKDAEWAIVAASHSVRGRVDTETAYVWLQKGMPPETARLQEVVESSKRVLNPKEQAMLAQALLNASEETLRKIGLSFHLDDRIDFQSFLEHQDSSAGDEGNPDTLLAKLLLFLKDKEKAYNANMSQDGELDPGILLTPLMGIDSEEKMRELLSASVAADRRIVFNGNVSTEAKKDSRVGVLIRNEEMTKITNPESLYLAKAFHDTDFDKLRRLGIEIGAIDRGKLETFIEEISKIAALPTTREGISELKSLLFERLILFLKHKRSFFNDHVRSPALLLQFGLIEKLGEGKKEEVEYKLKQLLSI